MKIIPSFCWPVSTYGYSVFISYKNFIEQIGFSTLHWNLTMLWCIKKSNSLWAFNLKLQKPADSIKYAINISFADTIHFQKGSCYLLTRQIAKRFMWLLPIPSASSKIIFTAFNIFRKHSNLLIMVKSKILPYEFTYLSMVENIWTDSKTIEHSQKYLNMVKKYLN